jgi:predicted acylesterase/phospholipase RssA
MDDTRNSRTYLVLGGGGIKAAAYHFGVCLALKNRGFQFVGGPSSLSNNKNENDLIISGYVGSSAGAFFAALLSYGHDVDSLSAVFNKQFLFSEKKTNSTIERIKYSTIFSLNKTKLFKEYLRFVSRKSKSDFGGFESRLKGFFKATGLFSMNAIEKYLEKSSFGISKFENLAADLKIVASFLDKPNRAIFGPSLKSCNIFSNNDEYFSKVSIKDAVAASMSLPPLFSPYCITFNDDSKEFFFDGEIRNTLSTDIAVSSGASLVISSYATVPYRKNETFGSLSNYGVPTILNQALYMTVEQKIEKYKLDLQQKRDLYLEISNLLNEKPFKLIEKNLVLNLIEKKLDYKHSVRHIFISPTESHSELFFLDHFSLDKKILDRIVKVGYKSAQEALNKFK